MTSRQPHHLDVEQHHASRVTRSTSFACQVAEITRRRPSALFNRMQAQAGGQRRRARRGVVSRPRHAGAHAQWRISSEVRSAHPRADSTIGSTTSSCARPASRLRAAARAGKQRLDGRRMPNSINASYLRCRCRELGRGPSPLGVFFFLLGGGGVARQGRLPPAKNRAALSVDTEKGLGET